MIYRGTLALASGHIIAITDLPGGCKRVRVRYAGGDADYRVTASGHCDYLTPGPPSGC
ncbi:hypothetical protein [Amycolatopsis lurida]|uniref:hypothetical protein n=1 Tax=Amycolatopsis lurida TaxID=31959 RepID=UPI000ACC92E2|nr:hypothetical protein [Amycolatopsis lurida]